MTLQIFQRITRFFVLLGKLSLFGCFIEVGQLLRSMPIEKISLNPSRSQAFRSFFADRISVYFKFGYRRTR